MLLVIIDIGIAVKKIATMQQKYVLPESTWSFLPFSDETAIAEQNRAMVPARICIDNKIYIVSFPLNSCWWLARDIIDHSAYFFDFINDSI